MPDNTRPGEGISFSEQPPRREFILAAATWQDDLLQGYRGIFLNLQSILLVIGVGLLVASLTIADRVAVLTLLGILSFLGVASLILLFSMKRIVISRGGDVDFWHKELLLAENDLDVNIRYFTQFKLFQKLNRHDSNYIRQLVQAKAPLTEAQAEELIGKGLGHTRRVIDRNLFSAAAAIWFALVVYGSWRIFATV